MPVLYMMIHTIIYQLISLSKVAYSVIDVQTEVIVYTPAIC